LELKKALESAKTFDRGHGRCEEYECGETMTSTIAGKEITKIECKSVREEGAFFV